MSDEEDWQSDSAIDVKSIISSTQSLTSSVLNYEYENGRRYHGFRAGQYFMPNDAQEQEGMDVMHHISRIILGGELFRAPVTDPAAILEIGTGTGVWAVDVADKFPDAYVIATDLSPIQSDWVPANLEFQVDDCESEWTFSADRKFDYIHMRNLGGAIQDWPGLLKKCYEHLNPGGWIECSNIEACSQSANNTLTAENASYQWQTNLTQAASMIGRKLNIGPDLHQLLDQAGFKDTFDDQHRVPMSLWPRGQRLKELAYLFQHLILIELEALSLRLFTQILGWSPEALQTLLIEVRKEIQNPAFQMFSVMHYAVGRKPEHAYSYSDVIERMSITTAQDLFRLAGSWVSGDVILMPFDGDAVVENASLPHTNHNLTHAVRVRLNSYPFPVSKAELLHAEGEDLLFISVNSAASLDLQAFTDKLGWFYRLREALSEQFCRFLLRCLTLEAFGYIRPVKLIGCIETSPGARATNPDNLCNDPFYGRPGYAPLMKCVGGYPDRSRFGKHVFVNTERDDQQYVLEACAGPYTGDSTVSEYIGKATDPHSKGGNRPGNIKDLSNLEGIQCFIVPRSLQRAVAPSQSSNVLIDRITQLLSTGTWSVPSFAAPFVAATVTPNARAVTATTATCYPRPCWRGAERVLDHRTVRAVNSDSWSVARSDGSSGRGPKRIQ